MSFKQIDRETGQSFTLDMTRELRSDLDQHWAADCKHSETKISRVTLANHSFQIRQVCQLCGGRVGLAVKKSEAPANCPDDDGSKEREFLSAREAALHEIYQRHIQKQKAAGTGYQEKYAIHLRSETWASKRALVLKRSGGMCEGCLQESANQIHHLTYQHVFNELLFELVALCDSCHDIAHTYEAVTEPEHQDLPCNSCRMGSWSESGGSACSKFGTSTGRALAKSGPCGPDAKQIEPLR